MDLGPVVQYVADSVKAGEALDLLLLNELLAQMTGELAGWGSDDDVDGNLRRTEGGHKTVRGRMRHDRRRKDP